MMSPSTEPRPNKRRKPRKLPRRFSLPKLQSTSTPRRWPRVDSKSLTTPRNLTSSQEPRETKDHKPLEVVVMTEEEAEEVVEEVRAVAAEAEPKVVISHSDQTPVDKLPPTRMVRLSKAPKEVETVKLSEERTVIENP